MHAIVVLVLWRIEWAWSRPDPTIRSAAIDESAPPASPLRPAGTESVVLPPSEKSFDMTHFASSRAKKIKIGRNFLQ